jgi:hypothetical protein
MKAPYGKMCRGGIFTCPECAGCGAGRHRCDILRIGRQSIGNIAQRSAAAHAEARKKYPVRVHLKILFGITNEVINKNRWPHRIFHRALRGNYQEGFGFTVPGKLHFISLVYDAGQTYVCHFIKLSGTISPFSDSMKEYNKWVPGIGMLVVIGWLILQNLNPDE